MSKTNRPPVSISRIVRTASPVRLDAPGAVTGRRVLVVEDGPTITHGGMAYGAGFVAASAAGAAAIVDPRACAVPEIAAVYAHHPHIGKVLPAMGYDARQLAALGALDDAVRLLRGDAGTIVRAPAETHAQLP
jgi:predicted GTPase